MLSAQLLTFWTFFHYPIFCFKTTFCDTGLYLHLQVSGLLRGRIQFPGHCFKYINSVWFFIYLCAEHNSQWPITESAQICTNNNNSSKLLKYLFIYKLYLQQKHLAERQWLKDQLNMVKLCMFHVGMWMPTVSRTERQYLIPLRTVIKNKALKWWCLICKDCKFNFFNILL